MISEDLAARRRQREATRINGLHARSWQLVSALRPEEFDRAQLGRADQIILDVEDAVDPTLKQSAREQMLAWFAEGGSGWVRINDVTTPDWQADLDAFVDVPGLKGVMLAKTENPDSVAATHHALAGIPVVPLVESALGIEMAPAIAQADGAYRLAFGSGDYRKDTGAENDRLAMAYPRSRLVVASRIGSLPGPIDGPTPFSTHAILREQTSDGVTLGMSGKLCLDHEQPVIINEVMAPSPADVAWATQFLEEFEANGRVIRDGSDKPRLGRAERICERASVFGIAAQSMDA